MNILYGLTPLISVIICLIFFLCFANSINKRPVLFYVFAIFLSVISLLVSFTLKHKYVDPMPFYYLVLRIFFGRGTVGTVVFLIVMYIGAVSNTNYIRKTLMQIRGTMSIMGGFFVLIHNILYGRKYFVLLFTNIEKLNTNKTISHSYICFGNYYFYSFIYNFI